MASPKYNTPIAALLLSLYAAVALSPAAAYIPFPAENTSIAEPPFSSTPAPAPAPAPALEQILFSSFAAAPYPAAASTFIAEPPFSAPALAPASEEMLFPIEGLNNAPISEKDMDSRYLTALMSAAAYKVEQFVAKEVEAKLQDPATADSDKECLSVCKEVYESAVESMKSGVERVGAGDFVKANFDVSAFNTDVDTCSDCNGGFEKFDQWAKGIAGDCLDRIVKYTNRI